MALRQRLAGGGGGVNPPEALAAAKDDMLDGTTKETPDGGAEPLPNHPDHAKSAQAAATESGASSPSPAPAKRKRRTKAEMEAARAAQAAQPAPSPVVPAVSDTASTGSEPDVNPPGWNEELAAAAAETAGHVIMNDSLREKIGRDAVEAYLGRLGLEGAIELVRLRLPRGVKSLEVEA